MAPPRRIEWLGTYFVPSNERKEEIVRLQLEDNLFTACMGGPLTEQADPTILSDVLDIACGSGGWAVEAAARYPALRVTGIDISAELIELARARAVAKKKSRRVTFQVMDALDTLAFDRASFDLVNMRLGSTFLRIWDWPVLLEDILRILRPGGIVRLTEVELTQQSSSLALARYVELMRTAKFHAGRLFDPTSNGLTAHLPRLLQHFGLRDVQSKIYPFLFEAGTPVGEACYSYFQHARTTLPFIQKWGIRQHDVETTFQQALTDMQQSGFRVSWNVHTTWGYKR